MGNVVEFVRRSRQRVCVCVCVCVCVWELLLGPLGLVTKSLTGRKGERVVDCKGLSNLLFF